MRLLFVIGTRPEAIKMAPLIRESQQRKNISFKVLSTGQHRELLKPILEWFGIVPDFELNVMAPNQTLAELSAKCLQGIDQVLKTNEFDWVLVQGDTTTALTASLAAFYNHIAVGHVEAGLRTGNKYSPWPEEVNRNLISKIATLHFAPTSTNRELLLRENIHEESIHMTGNTVIDALLFSSSKVAELQLYPAELAPYFIGSLKSVRIVLITGHRRESFGDGFVSICRAIQELAHEHPDVHFIYPVHFNPNVRVVVEQYLKGIENVRLIEPLGYPEFIGLMKRSYLILTDSGGIQEEGPSLGKPVLVMRDNTERPEALAYHTVKLVGTDFQKIKAGVTQLLSSGSDTYVEMSKAVNPYGDGHSAARIISILEETIR